ncbi:unnamed protein product [Cuscuta epithymum]|uniref:Uncharacterized protein n=1 Tax=Cuscuta epithymum TaxID=186058 RepID=A0AAV0GF40_9ASTE|nr:unnamed protein product [Cuscuta epithymum]
MYEFGEELLIESYKVPWLIWIQLLVMVLLFLLLFFGFSVFSLDLSNNSASTSGAGGSSFSAGSDNGFGDGRQAHRPEQMDEKVLDCRGRMGTIITRQVLKQV